MSSHTTVPDSRTHCISSGLRRSENSLRAASSSTDSTPDTRSNVLPLRSMYSSSTPTVSGGPAPNRWSSTLADCVDAPLPLPDAALPLAMKSLLPQNAAGRKPGGLSRRGHVRCHGAEVAELADAPDSKSGGRKAVWVRFPPSALKRRGHARRDATSKPFPATQNQSADGARLQALSARRHQPATKRVGVTYQDDARAWLRGFDRRARQLARRLAGDPKPSCLATHARAPAAEADTFRRLVNGEPVDAIAASRRTSPSIVRRQLRSAVDRIRRLTSDGLVTAADRHVLATLGDAEHGQLTMNDAATLAGYGFEDGHTLIGYHDPNVSRRKDRALRRFNSCTKSAAAKPHRNCSNGLQATPRDETMVGSYGSVRKRPVRRRSPEAIANALLRTRHIRGR